MRIGAVIVAYKSSDAIGECVDCLLKDPTVSVAVVDNAREPECAAECARFAPEDSRRLTYVDPRANLGYGRAANLGLAALGAVDFVAVVNPDAVIREPLSALATLLEPTHFAVVAGRLDSVTGINARPLVTMVGELRKAVLGSRAYRADPALRGDGRLLRVEQLDGAFLLLRSSTWRALGGFDPRFELYYEDVDLCARAASLGGCALVDRVWGSHVGGESFRASGGTAFVVLRVSRVRFLRTWFGTLRGSLLAALVAALEFVARTVSRQPEGDVARCSALGHQLKELARPGTVWLLRAPGEGDGKG